MRRRVPIVALTGVMTLVVGWVTAAPAGAAVPQFFHMKINQSFHFSQCGFTFDSVVRGTLTSEVFFNRSGVVIENDEAHVVSTLTNEANRKVVYVGGGGLDRFTPADWRNPS